MHQLRYTPDAVELSPLEAREGTSMLPHREGSGKLLSAPRGHMCGSSVLVLVLIKNYLIIKRMLTTWHPYTQASFSCQCLQVDIGKRMLPSPPASLLSKYGRNRIKAKRRTKTQLKRMIRANVCLVRRPCQNQFIADSQRLSHIEHPALLNVIDPD